MKKIYSIVAALLLTTNVWAQAPQKMSYQAVIRNSSDALIKNTKVGMKISILQGSITGTVTYAETQTPTTNINGLVSLEIGKGSIVTGTFGSINWANGPYFIKTETDPTGGTSYTIAGTSELMSVPYSLFAANGLPNGAAAGNTPYWNGTAWVTNSSNIFNNGAFVGLGTTTPSNPLTIQHNYVGGGIMNSGNGGNGPGYILGNNGTEGGSFGLSNGAGNYVLGSQNGDIALRNASTTRGILFSTGGTPYNPRLAILANGNIGVGT
ncbi:MAG: collagen-like protein, partial [Bacteroidota bacterium]